MAYELLPPSQEVKAAQRRELLYRQDQDKEVTIWYVPESDIVLMGICRARAMVEFELPREKVMEAYNHPFMFMHLAGVEFPEEING